jgi:hypothetical protein
VSAGRHQLLLCFGLLPIFAFGQPQPAEPAKTTVCEIAAHPDRFDGKIVQVRAVVDSGVQDLPSGVGDDSCGAELTFFMPADPQFGKLVKSKGFQKLMKDVKRNPVVQATVTGLFKRFGTSDKPDNRLALESVENVTVIPQPHVRDQKR